MSLTGFRKFLPALLLACVCTLGLGCSRTSSDVPFRVRSDSARTGGHASPRTSASSQLTEQGRSLLESGRVDDAIGVFEQSVGLDPANGRNYYYLSECWRIKGNIAQAEEFNSLAGLYLKGDAGWTFRAIRQKEKIDDLRKMQGELGKE